MRKLMFTALALSVACFANPAAAQSSYDIIENSMGQVVGQIAGGGVVLNTSVPAGTPLWTVSVRPGNPLQLSSLPTTGSTVTTCAGTTRLEQCSSYFSVYVSPTAVSQANIPSRAARTPPARMCTSGWYLVYYNGSWECFLRGNTRSTIRQ